jgi:signal transduction histidine kinase
MLIPFQSGGVAIGSVWLVSHSDGRKFDREDERALVQLTQFAAAYWQLLRSTEQLAALNRRKDDFLALLGHELRTPLGAIFAATAVLNSRVAADPVASGATAMIGRQSRHLLRLADDVLDIARIEKGKLALNRRRIDARKVVSDSVSGLRARIEERGHSLTLELGREHIWLDADPMRLTQVVSNLVENAAKYTPDNGQIMVKLTTEDNHAVLSVRDSGVGILPEQAQQIFEPFLQLHTPIGMASGGIGLGLALVKSLIEMHGGTVMVESGGAGSGSCFSIRLPMNRRRPKRRANGQ